MINERLKQLRNAKGFSQKQFAQQLNVSASTVGMYEQGRRTPDSNTLARIADIMDCSTDYILGRVDDPEVKIIPKEMLPEELAQYIDYIEVLKDIDLSDVSPNGLKMLIEAAKKLNRD